MNGHISIALDGPSGVGKSTIAKKVAEKLGLIYIDTGAMFRGLAVFFTDRGVDINDREACERAVEDAEVSIRYIDGVQHVLVNAEDVTSRLRTEVISHAASVTSQYPAVRKRLLELQRELAEKESVIMDGRDIGTVVLPNATVKIFLTADPHERAIRRYKQLTEQGKADGLTLESVEQDLCERDYRDSHRESAPLRQAEDAILLDSTRLSIEEVEAAICGEIEKCR